MDQNTKDTIEQVVDTSEKITNFWLQVAGAAAHGFSAAAQERQQSRIPGSVPRRNDFYRAIAIGLHEAIRHGEQAAARAVKEFSPTSNGDADEGDYPEAARR